MKYILYFILWGVLYYAPAQVSDSIKLNQSEIIVFKQIETLDSNLLKCELNSLSDVLNM